QHVERERHQLQADVERDQIEAAGQKHHTDGGEQHQRVVFAVLFAFNVEIASGDQDGECCTHQEDSLKYQREAVEADHAVEAVDGKRSPRKILNHQTAGSQDDTGKRKISNEFALAIWQDNFHDQRQASAESQNQLRDNELQVSEIEEPGGVSFK